MSYIILYVIFALYILQEHIFNRKAYPTSCILYFYYIRKRLKKMRCSLLTDLKDLQYLYRGRTDIEKVSSKCRCLFEIGKDNSPTIKRATLLLLQYQILLRIHQVSEQRYYAVPKNKEDLFIKLWLLKEYCESHSYSRFIFSYSKLDILNILTSLANEVEGISYTENPMTK